MYFIKIFILSYILNDGRILSKIFGKYLEYIKYKVVLIELGIFPLMLCIFLNFFKGFFLFSAKDPLSGFISALLLLIGNYLGAKPGVTCGSEIMLLCGILFRNNYSLVQIPLACFLGLIIIMKNFKLAFYTSLFIMCVNLIINNDYYLFLISVSTLLFYLKANQELFFDYSNRIKREKIFIKLKEVNNI